MKSDVVMISSSDDGTGHSCGFEFVPNRKKQKAIYVVFRWQTNCLSR